MQIKIFGIQESLRNIVVDERNFIELKIFRRV